MRLIARFAQELGDEFEIITVYDRETLKEYLSKNNPTLNSIAHKHPAAIWFERKMSDDFGIQIEGGFDTRKLVHQERFPPNIHHMLKHFDRNSVLEMAAYTPYPYERIQGDSIFEVSVGPIHAGIIEPGHFHFSQAGEDILHLEVRHFYKYRGIEKMVEGLTLYAAKPIIERISGNASIAYQIAFRDIMLQAYDALLPQALQKQDALLLELERIIHHLTDIGFIPNDAGFSPALALASTLSEHARRLMKKITGHRFGFGAITLNAIDLDKALIEDFLNLLEKEVLWFKSWVYDVSSLWDRLDTTGVFPQYKARKFDTVGVVARASDLALDRRYDDPFYKENGFRLITDNTCDVGARFRVRIEEIVNAIDMMRNFLDTKPVSIHLKAVHDGAYCAYTESALGELFMYINIKNGVIERFFVRDPSFMNWQALHVMMPNNIIADFPLINKSCDLSYAGNDL